MNSRLTMQRLLSITLIMVIANPAFSQEDREHQGPQTCGGRLKGSMGIIQTPNFPNQFPVPIKCKWIIEHDIVNGTISIYFTQQYTTSGLTFTEYIYYDESYKLGERKAFIVTEENITRVKWLQVQSPVLVVEFNLGHLEGTQLRALGLLSVFGFNMTYAVRRPADPPDPPSCSAIECRLLGHCYANHNFKEFFCSCFDGYSGADCGVGPLCPKSPSVCKNGGTCRQMGPAAVTCICTAGYTGDFCELQVTAPECGIEECSDGCRSSSCDCLPKDNDFTTAKFETRLQLDPNVKDISNEVIINQITSYLKTSNITLEDDVEILNVSSQQQNNIRTVWLRIWSPRKEAGALRAVLARLVATKALTDKLKLMPSTLHFDMQPALTLHALSVNQRPQVWEGSEFILSCMAYGSPDIQFTWHKDGVKVNFNGTARDIWTRTVAEDALGRRMSVLGISEAKSIDSGRWSCSAKDAGRKRCKAMWLSVLRPPDIKLMPSTLTVNKGDNISITCLAGAGRVHGVLGFSWAREKNLLPLAPGREVWEDLYPAGSVLKLYNIQKSSEFRCQVSSVAGTNSKGVRVWALGAKSDACDADASHGIRWPKTAPGAYASAACPPGHSGETSRFCEPKTTQHGVIWRSPDFSGCIDDSLKDIFDHFLVISYGYSWKRVADVTHQYLGVLRSLPVHPGEGTLQLTHVKSMVDHLMSSAGTPHDRKESAEYILRICDHLLKHPDTFLDEEKIYDLQRVLVHSAGFKESLQQQLSTFTVSAKPVKDDNAHFKFYPIRTDSEEWLPISAGIELEERTINVTAVAVEYVNLASRLPSLKRSIAFVNGREIEYQIASQQVQLGVSGPKVDTSLPHTVSVLFTHAYNYSAIGSKLACALRTTSNPRSWSMESCEIRIPESAHAQCKCRGLGTFALFTVARSTLTDAEKDLKSVVKITVGAGGALCLLASAFQLLGLVPSRKTRLPVLLKAATAGSHSAAILALLECDTRQEEACPGPIGWVCAACWCAGCAALCAQPLLLQAELAGRTQNGSSVGLLAGVSTLAWLTAKLWGGSPLQYGAAAQIVCTAGCMLLIAICLALSVCSILRLRTVKHKVPAERKNYLRERGGIVRHTMILIVTTSAAQAAAILYAQPGERRTVHVIALSAAAISNGIAMFLCYVIRDDDCIHAAKRLVSFTPHRKWQESPDAGDTSLSLYIKQAGEVESRGGVSSALDGSLSHASPMASYWRAPDLESPRKMHRRSSMGDSRADIVQCVEYRDTLMTPQHYQARQFSTTHAICDLIPHSPPKSQPEYMARVCLELGLLNTPAPKETDGSGSLLTCSVDFQPYLQHNNDIAKESCSLCVQSNPDVSKIPSPPIKSCLKKTNQDFSSSISLPSMEALKDDSKMKSDIEEVNREWNKAYDSPETEKVLNKITSDLDFLLNRTKENNTKLILDEIEEAPT